MLEVVNHSGCQFIHRNIFHIVLVDEKFLQILDASLPAEARTLADVATLVAVLYLLVEFAERLAEHRRLLQLAEKCLFQSVGIDHLIAHDELVVDFTYLGTDGIKIAVQFKVLFGLAFRLTFGRIPVVGSYIPVGIYLRTLPIHRYSQQNGKFALFVGAASPDHEVQ